jgi:type I restriction-modification system DNA methylase subunit
MLVNASAYFVKEKPTNALTDEGIRAVADVYARWETREKLSRVITLEEARAADYNLSPSQFVEVNDKATHRLLSEILADLKKARVERERADAARSCVGDRLDHQAIHGGGNLRSREGSDEIRVKLGQPKTAGACC